MLVRGQARWAVRGMAASYGGFKTVEVNVAEEDSDGEVREKVKRYIRRVVAERGCWNPHQVEVYDLEVEVM